MQNPPIRTVPLSFQRLPQDDMAHQARSFLERMSGRRSVRHFSADPVPRELIEAAIATAHTAPSGANRQPWHFVAVSDPSTKAEIRRAAEAEERRFYEDGGATAEWLAALEPLGTGWRKEFLETAPWLVAVFKQVHGVTPDGGKITNYYVNESVGIACGLFIAAIHQMGLATLTHTPQPMRFLSRILERPSNERPYILFPVGFPAAGCRVPELPKRPLSAATTWIAEEG